MDREDKDQELINKNYSDLKYGSKDYSDPITKGQIPSFNEMAYDINSSVYQAFLEENNFIKVFRWVFSILL